MWYLRIAQHLFQAATDPLPAYVFMRCCAMSVDTSPALVIGCPILPLPSPHSATDHPYAAGGSSNVRSTLDCVIADLRPE